MKLKAALWLLFLSIHSSIFAYQMVDSDPPSKSQFYLKGGMTSFLPTAGAGFRYEKGHHGLDCSGSFGSIGFGNLLVGKLLYLNHPFSLYSLAHNFYMGLGIGIGQSWASNIFAVHSDEVADRFLLSFEQSIGYQWEGEKRVYFAQFEFGETILEARPLFIPALSLGFGF